MWPLNAFEIEFCKYFAQDIFTEMYKHLNLKYKIISVVNAIREEDDSQ